MSTPEMTQEQAEHLVSQLQQAHRLSVGFYKRILPTLDKVANELKCEFWEWKPLHTQRPPNSGTRPGSKWAWDYVPLFASGHTYGRCSDEAQTRQSDYAIEFYLYIEDTFEPSKRGSKGQPDPIALPSGKSVLRAWLYRPKGDFDEPFDDLWSEENNSEPGDDNWASVSEHFEAIALEWPLAKVIADIQAIVNELKRHVGETE